VFLTGRGGCGKSKALRELMAALDASGSAYAVTAASGVAAEMIGGVTLHSYMCIHDSATTESCISRAEFVRGPQLRALRVLIVDEVSMVSAAVMARTLAILEGVRGVGAPRPVLVLAGDFLQLPPPGDGAGRRDLLLNSPTWANISPQVLLLKDAFRQTDLAFVRVLDEARIGSLSDASVRVLEGRVGAGVSSTVPPSVLLPINRTVDEINARHLATLADHRTFAGRVFLGASTAARSEDPAPGADHGGGAGRDLCLEPEAETDTGSATSQAKWVPADTIMREHDGGVAVRLSALPPAALATPCVAVQRCGSVQLPHTVTAWLAAERLVAGSNAAPLLELAVGAQVVFVANVAPPDLVNGSRGVVTAFAADGAPVVQLANGAVVTAKPFQRAVRVVANDPRTAYVYEQLPLRLAWALTIHKAQGMSIDAVRIDLGPDVFEAGQAYVALSRVRTLAGLSLMRFDPRSVKADAAVVRWYKAQERVADHASAPSAAPSAASDAYPRRADDEDEDVDEDEDDAEHDA
jgi:ATP-dependent DNA helicase PIF1